MCIRDRFAGGTLVAVLGGGPNATAAQLLIAVPLASALIGASIGAAERFARKVWIEVVDGPLGGRELILYGDRAVLGSSDSSTISLADDTLESEHAELLVLDDVIELRSLEPRAVVKVNDEAISRTPIEEGDLIELGRTWLRVHRS